MSGHSSKPFHFQEIIASDRGPSTDPEPSSFNRTGHPDAAAALASLKDSITAGYHGLDPILETITDVARLLTGASGAALAMWKDGAMLCRARSGDSAPALGAQLNAETGISGECLRTGQIQHCTDAEADPRVDAEACRSRGLRSIAVLPIRSKRETNGILLAFSTEPAAFTDSHIAILQQLASLAEQARAATLQGLPSATAAPARGDRVLPVRENRSSNLDQPQSSAVMPELDRLLDLPLASEFQSGYRRRPIVLGSVALAAVALLASVIWLGWRGSRAGETRARYSPPRPTGTAVMRPAGAGAVTADPSGNRVPDNDPVWQPNPGGESLSPAGVNTSTDSSVKLASQLDKAAAANIATITISDRVPRPQIRARAGSPPELHAGLPPDETASAEPPALASGSTPQADVSDVLSPTVSLPATPVQVSQGISGGQLLSSILPEYPAAARHSRLEGEVVLQITVMEDGTVGDIKVIRGSPPLAQSAVDAVKNWRYQPYQLNGKPVKNETNITVDFALRSGAASR
jgi:TonB family protein